MIFPEYQSDESTGPVGHVLKVLSYLDRPRNAVASSIQEGMSEDPNQTALGGFWRGLTGDKEVHNTDLLGMEGPKPEQGWGEWLGRGATQLGADAIGDPLNLLFGVGAITKGLGLSAKGVSAVGRVGRVVSKAAAPEGYANLAEYLGSTGLGKAFQAYPWGNRPVQEAMDAIQGKSGALARETRGTIEEAMPKVAEWQALNPETNTMGALREALERPDKAADLGVPQDLLSMVQPLQDKALELHETRNVGREALDMTKIGTVKDPTYAFMPRQRKDLGAV